MRDVWKVDETLSPVPESIPRCKLKLRKTTEKLFYAIINISTSAPTKRTIVVIMLCVTTPGDPITARARMDFMETE